MNNYLITCYKYQILQKKRIGTQQFKGMTEVLVGSIIHFITEAPPVIL